MRLMHIKSLNSWIFLNKPCLALNHKQTTVIIQKIVSNFFHKKLYAKNELKIFLSQRQNLVKTNDISM